MPTETDVDALVHERTRRATSVYERHAYLVYNLALRVTCSCQAADRATERTFLTRVTRPDPDADVGATAVRGAREEAPERPPAEDAGDPDEARLLRATAALPAAQRAALALTGLCGVDERGVAATLDLGQDGAATLVEASRGALGARLGVTAQAADEAYAMWAWASPPEALWQSLWPQLHEALVQSSRSGGGTLRAQGGDSGAGGAK
ncbi:MAG TPA: hypothetical protein VGW10_08035, partial [Solirubrobacteraceae bacterium]|nr:hypothetical protein [Solirubrobacteraceae bacterium]